MKNWFVRTLATIGKYAVLMAVIYFAVNWWRSPELPTANQTHLPVAITQTSFERPVLLYFWGTWCGVCQFTSPAVNQTHQDGYAVSSIAVQSGTPDEVQHYMTQHQYHFDVIHDETGEIFQAWQGKVTPSFAIIKNGEVVQSFAGITPAWLLKTRLIAANYL